jgi:hypothetical protein
LDTALGNHFNYRRLEDFFFAAAFFVGAASAGLVRWLITFFGPVLITELSAVKFSVTLLWSSANRIKALSRRDLLWIIACSAASND